MIAVDLLAFTQTVLLHDTPLARAEPKTLRYRLLHVAARFTRGQRRLWLRIDRHWPWALSLAAAFTRLGALPTPTGRPPSPTRRAAGATGRTAGRLPRHARPHRTPPTAIKHSVQRSTS